MILPQAAFGLPMTIVILRGFFREIPGELEEAATLDGCSPFGFFWRILLPLARPALGTVSVLAIVGSWNNFLLPCSSSANPPGGPSLSASNSSRASTPPTWPASSPIWSSPWRPPWPSTRSPNDS